MPATPAWPPRSTPRLFIEDRLAPGARIELDKAQTRYLTTVMRRQEGDPVRVFDDATGDYVARIVQAGGARCTLEVEEKLAGREQVPDLWLCAAPVHKDNFALVAEKASELGVRRLLPVVTQRCQHARVNEDRLRKRMIEAAEQCERSALPKLGATQKLAALLGRWPADRTLFVCDETGGAPAARAFADISGPAAILIGPEGGFAPEEREAILALPQSRGIALGPRILRAETAAIAAVSLWMGAAGDWT
ncbi:16S rRNA (uracil(1498)-N(3))-methyltransferase [Aurantiacibacter spongiae]|uniref:Ribosomal RNA small subunit methyltransferase E n=1 Tax=Aurantiacibacter spongiae TaxID=2488860 RepID=A0A3N5DNZ6_9SPHN|nr:16S rRNA (uracil(1498)-N(3))-methyltransferase [Aurantiacibacter spongiae]RPF70811.1 16S rRNA (uracil(1498)-N(3))-methyltransferase [Aurantiacibacter spongiae]